jgi:hypothetical protein
MARWVWRICRDDLKQIPVLHDLHLSGRRMSIPNRYQRGNAGGGAAQRRRPIIEGPAEADCQCDATASNRMHGQDGGQRTYTIGKHGSPWSPDTARQEARRILGEVVKDMPIPRPTRSPVIRQSRSPSYAAPPAQQRTQRTVYSPKKSPQGQGVTQGASLCCEVPRSSARHCKASGFRAFVASQARQRKRRQVRGPKKAPRELGGQGGARLGEYVNVPECSTRHQDDIAVGGLRHCETGARQRPLELAEHSQHPADGVEVSRHWRSRKRSTSRACSSPAQPDRSMTPCGHDVELAPSDTLQQRIQSRPLIAPLVPLMLSSR